MTRALLLTSVLLLCWSCKTTKSAVQSAPLAQFSTEQLNMIKSGDASQPMRVYKTTSESDSLLLRRDSDPVIIGVDSAAVRLFTQRLFATVRDSMSLGVGIAAPQVGILKDIIWVQRFDKEGFPFEVYLNPSITQYSDKKQDCMEGCLSIPDQRGTTKTRAYAILLEYDTLAGQHKVEMVEDFTAMIFQHEIDHLHGLLFTDLLD